MLNLKAEQISIEESSQIRVNYCGGGYVENHKENQPLVFIIWLHCMADFLTHASLFYLSGFIKYSVLNT